MKTTERLRKRTDQVLDELAALGPMRKGSVSEQMVKCTLKDGTSRQRGPYALYSFKERGQTTSKRLGDSEQIALYRKQIAAFRRFEELMADMARLGQQRADLEAAGDQGGKKNSRR